ncbi:MAG: type II secretion system protein [bacterium]|nr:type II secretion system protein [bacterium]
MRKNHKGFTLIELLVVIAIIGLLSTLAVISLSAARTRARDSKRVADARNVQSALELYASEKGTYPIVDVAAGVPINNATTGGCIDRKDDPGVGLELADGSNCKEVLMKLPKSQTNLTDDNFNYKSNSSGTNYVIWFYIEATKKYNCATPSEIKTETDVTTCKALAI